MFKNAVVPCYGHPPPFKQNHWCTGMKLKNTRHGGFSEKAFQELRKKRNDKNVVLEFAYMTNSITGRRRIEPVTSVYAVTPLNAYDDQKTNAALMTKRFPDYADYGQIRTAGYYDVSGIKTYSGLVHFTQNLGVQMPEKKRSFPVYKPDNCTVLKTFRLARKKLTKRKGTAVPLSIKRDMVGHVFY